MAWRLRFTESYLKNELKFLRRHPDLKTQYGKALALLEANPHHPSLRLHALAGRREGLHSVSITLSYRITIEFVIRETTIVPIQVGSHDEVY
ncbi:type II toxin-antitoxin system RelE/ParE family toxin [Ramlibacter sp.]|uniref:type II toxin-antitoxin system RelE/ParE family toxin n=1 Tax=Ramlibacter sp. TaxID=1917967 RepID=UPI003D0D0C6F